MDPEPGGSWLVSSHFHKPFKQFLIIISPILFRHEDLIRPFRHFPSLGILGFLGLPSWCWMRSMRTWITPTSWCLPSWVWFEPPKAPLWFWAAIGGLEPPKQKKKHSEISENWDWSRGVWGFWEGIDLAMMAVFGGWNGDPVPLWEVPKWYDGLLIHTRR